MRNKKIIICLLIFFILMLSFFALISCNPQEDDTKGEDKNTEESEDIILKEGDPFFLPAPEVNEILLDYTDKRIARIVFVDQNNIERVVNIALFEDEAPITCENFITLAESKHYDGTIIHRLVPNFVLQGGGYNVEESGGRYIIHDTESVPSIFGEFYENGFEGNIDILHEPGVISMARTSDKDSATDQFFICLDNQELITSSLDGKYAAFGKCIDTMSLYNVIELGKSKTIDISQAMEDFAFPFIYIASIEIVEGVFLN